MLLLLLGAGLLAAAVATFLLNRKPAPTPYGPLSKSGETAARTLTPGGVQGVAEVSAAPPKPMPSQAPARSPLAPKPLPPRKPLPPKRPPL